ncbi:hypothetical protein KGF57_005113 [Candida theae]|uniref:DNA mismatch repair proteins mutS family domain-containing protein n=1 Tax=Candida theae TaxID=1198502 RepID=A0AAD5BA77_9ASCO|nr:uncharacterized protein KGF57_005113 [Candida theae]KAI5948920.1 hypothetical protein KGF57_005113 [Candida theae]
MRLLIHGTRLARQTGILNIRGLTTTKKCPKRLPKWDRGGRTDRVSGEVRGTEAMGALHTYIKRMIDEHPKYVFLTQVGGFYELYFHQAVNFGPKLGLSVAFKKTSNHSIPMAGFPLSQVTKYTEMLVQECGEIVAIVDQDKSMDKTNQNLIHRSISKIITPGTLVDESFLNHSRSNYLVAISFPSGATNIPANPDMSVGLTWVDVSVGETFVQQTTLGSLISDLARINPSEILISEEYNESSIPLVKWHPPLQVLQRYCVRYHKSQSSGLKPQFRASVQAVRKAFEDLSMQEQSALVMALSYISKNLPKADSLLDLPTRYYNASTLQMDSRTREALELTDRVTSGRISVVGTLLSSIRRTCTTSGARLLAQWLKSPLLDIEEIEKRQKYVKTFIKNQHLRIGVQQRLQKLSDFVRIAQRLSAGRGDDVANLKLVADALNELQQLKDFLCEVCRDKEMAYKVISDFVGDFHVPRDVAESISNAIVEDETIMSEVVEDTDSDAGIADPGDSFESYKLEESPERVPTFGIRKDYNSNLSVLHRDLAQLLEKEQQYMSSLQSTLSTYNPKVSVVKKDKYNSYTNILHISANKQIAQIADVLESDISHRFAKSFLYHPPNWTALQSKIEDTRAAIKQREDEVVQKLKAKMLNELPSIRSLSKSVDFLDVTASFAVIADENNWVCPKVVKTPKLEITRGRHVTVESSLKGSGEMFTPNDTKLGSSSKLWVISGPNMGGKSTYLRQNALIIILAQIGSYVPADSATIGVVDKIFTRIGASDDLFNDLSTFMVEMIETSNILLNGTKHSFAIVDEVGRGTSGKEGLAIAYAVLVHLLTKTKCRTLFATHFGNELRDILQTRNVDQKCLEFYKTTAFKFDCNSPLRIDHTLVPGISDRSYAIEVARNAGFPVETLEESEEVLDLLLAT